MKKRFKISLITAAVLVLVGLLIIGIALCTFDGELSAFGTETYETNSYEIAEPFHTVSVQTDTADLVLARSEDDRCHVICYESEKEKHEVSVTDGVLKVTAEDTRAWYEYIGVNFQTTKITVYLPEGAEPVLYVKESTGDVTIPSELRLQAADISVSTGHVTCHASVSEALCVQATTGDIAISGVSADRLELSVSTGNITVSDLVCAGDVTVHVSTGKATLQELSCRTLTSTGSTGDLILQHVTASEHFLLERSTGDVRFDRCDAAEITVQTSTGEVTGSLLSEKVFVVHTGTGAVEVPDSINGGPCKITTQTGNVKITLS